MLHLRKRRTLSMYDGSYRLAGNAVMMAAARSQHPLQFVGKDFDEARQHFRPILENPFRAGTACQLEVARNQISYDLRILRAFNRLQIDRSQIASLLGEIAALIKNVSDAAAHARCEIPPARSQHDHQPVCHVLAAVIADSLHHRSGPRVTHRKAFAGNAVEERLSTRGPVEHNISDQDVLFRSELGCAWRIYNQAPTG